MNHNNILTFGIFCCSPNQPHGGNNTASGARLAPSAIQVFGITYYILCNEKTSVQVGATQCWQVSVTVSNASSRLNRSRDHAMVILPLPRVPIPIRLHIRVNDGCPYHTNVPFTGSPAHIEGCPGLAVLIAILECQHQRRVHQATTMSRSRPSLTPGCYTRPELSYPPSKAVRGD